MPGPEENRKTRASTTARVCLLIPTHALPPLTYGVPEGMEVRVGSVVVATLSGRSRCGVVLSLGGADERATENLRSVSEELSLPEGIVRLCEWAAGRSAVSVAAALRSALPPGIETDRYRIVRPAPGWKWGAGDLAGRLALKRFLGEEGFKAAEAAGRIELSPRLPPARAEEWAVAANGAEPDFGRARRQRDLFEVLRGHGGEMPVARLLSGTGASRGVLRSLARRGAVTLEARPSRGSVIAASGEERPDAGFGRGVSSLMERGGAHLWRVPSGEVAGVICAVARLALGAGGRTLVLAPEIRQVNDLVERLRRSLPEGTRLAAYHGEAGRDRPGLWKAAGLGEVEVLVGTRTAALVPIRDLGAICIADEPNEAHRAEPGYEGLPIHVRELAIRRGEAEGCPVLFPSPTPSLRLYASNRATELPPRRAKRWPSVRLVDTRGSGATLSSTLVAACRDALEAGESAGVVVDRLGYATSVSCLRCGSLRTCPSCDLPMTLHGRRKTLVCARCGHREKHVPECPECGSSRLAVTGVSVGRVREELSEALDAEVGLLTAGERESEAARVVVGTARPVLARRWDTVALPDADAFLAGGWMGSVERAFRVFFAAAESARSLLVAQTRNPEHYALQSALREDYRAFAAAEVPRLRRMGYPPFSHLASLVFRGDEEEVRRAVKSRLLPGLEAEVEASEPVPVAGPGTTEWRVVLRSRSREAVARAGGRAAGLATKGLAVRVEIDPEEV